MQCVILAGGKGTRLSEYTKIIPKPMVTIGKLPILVHIINYFIKHNIKKFIIASGYKQEVIKKYFKNFKRKDCTIKVIFTGKNTLTGGRLLKLKKYLLKENNFILTYGDGLSNQNLNKLIKFHKRHKKIATLTAVRPPVRFGELTLKKNFVYTFKEKPQIKQSWINGGFFVFKSDIFKYLKRYNEMLEKEPMEKLSRKKQLMAFKHKGFWQCMDTARERSYLKKLIKSKKAPWLK